MGSESENEKYFFKVNRIQTYVDIDHIMYIEVHNRIITLHTKGSMVEFYSTMREEEKKLAEYCFIRVHHGYLVNMKYIKEIRKTDLVLTNDEKIPISRAKRKNVFIQYLWYKQAVAGR